MCSSCISSHPASNLHGYDRLLMPPDNGTDLDNAALADELEALNSIYESDTLTVKDYRSDVTTSILRLPELPISFLVSFPRDYPDVPPVILGTESTGGSGKGEGEIAVNILRDVLGRTWVPGQVCLFDLVEEAGPLLQQQHGQHIHGATEDNIQDASDRSAVPGHDERHESDLTPEAASSMDPPPWTMSDPMVVSKSTFVARVCRVSSLDEAQSSISHLLSTNKKVATATHNIQAWRIQNVNSSSGITSTIQDCDDDGETAAGGRLLHLLQLMDVWNVVVVVTRWYGGVKLGPDRFRLINSVAREALVKGGFVKDEGDKPKGKGKNKK